MTFQVTISPSGRRFDCEADETVLAAALRAKLILPYGCKNGACGSCKGVITSGTVQHGAHQQKALSDEEVAQGSAIFCCALPQSDLTIVAREMLADDDYPIKKMPARIAKLEKLADDVMLIALQLPAVETLNYRAGQYIEFILKGGKRRSYSLANAPHIEQPLTLHVRHMAGGLFTDQVFSTLKERDIVRFEGPFGSFFLREDSDKPMILLASGTGFAPIKALVEQMIALGSQRPMHLYWGGRRPQDLYMQALCEEWQAALPQLKYIPVISDAAPEDQWQGRTGFVHQAVLADHTDLSGFQVYACGAPIVIESARRDFVAQCGLLLEEFFADSFTSEADNKEG
ncbi:MAG: CDP-6-deoxy-delta-3,4-glucoseen reductase [Undibacterium sp.]|nr:CDP-6-deoxy-delta-3,4-glucoseen reductase [Undibacterium sp.]